MKLFFVTDNKFKKREATEYLRNSRIKLEIYDYSVQEIMHYDLEEIVRDKCLKAYELIRTPCVVEHGGLYINAWGKLPAGLSKVFWDKIDGDICKLVPNHDRSATAKVVVGFCDGKNIKLFEGETKGRIAKKAKGKYKFQWDPIFIPEGSEMTFAQLGSEGKAKYSQARKAWKKLATYIQNNDLHKYQNSYNDKTI